MGALISEVPMLTDDQRRRDALMGRLASALAVMRDEAIDPARIEEAMLWRLRDDLGHLLDAWDAAHPSRATA